jgi:5-methyltetrahydrofolate--homocysteine methyltransferase
MKQDTILADLKDAVIRGIPSDAAKLAEDAVAAGIDPVLAIEEGLKPGISVVGDGFASGELYLPDLVLAAETMKAASAILEAEIARLGVERVRSGRVLLGTVVGDLHDIGKTIVATLLTSHGFDVIDLGVNVSVEDFLNAVQEEEPDLLGMSSLLTVTAKELGNVIEALEDSNRREGVKVIVGGGAVTDKYAEMIGADGYGHDAEMGVRVAKELIGL